MPGCGSGRNFPFLLKKKKKEKKIAKKYSRELFFTLLHCWVRLFCATSTSTFFFLHKIFFLTTCRSTEAIHTPSESRQNAPHMLKKLLTRAGTTPAVFAADDLYRICVLVKNQEDVLGLRKEKQFLQQLRCQYRKLKASSAASISPFQKSVLDDVLSSGAEGEEMKAPSEPEAAGGSGGSSLEGVTPKAVEAPKASAPPTALERLTEIWTMIDEARAEKTEFSGERMKTLEIHMKALESQLRQLTPTETASLVKALASIHYRNYHHTSILGRRSCEVASELPPRDSARLYANLTKLQSVDSLMPLVNRLVQCAKELSVKEVQELGEALQKQGNSSFAGGKLLSAVLTCGTSLSSQAKTPTFHRSLIAAAARYNYSKNPAIDPLLRDLTRFSPKSFHLKDASVLLRSMVALDIPAAHTLYTLLIRVITEKIDAALEIREVDGLMTILSEVPVDTTAAMCRLMTRLENDAGKLTITQLVNVLQLLSSYPPARGHVCVVSLAFAVQMRSESIEAAALEDVLLSLGQLNHFTDDFFSISRALFGKGGFRSFQALYEVLQACSPQILQGEDGAELVKAGILQLAPILNDGELQQCRKLLLEKGINDKTLHQRVLSRAKQLQRGGGGASGFQHNTGNHRTSGKGKRRYDPMDDLIM